MILRMVLAPLKREHIRSLRKPEVGSAGGVPVDGSPTVRSCAMVYQTAR